MGLAQYGPDCPIFSEDVSLEESIGVATDVMEAVLEGESINPIRAAGDHDQDDVDEEPESEDENEVQMQTSLGDW